MNFDILHCIVLITIPQSVLPENCIAPHSNSIVGIFKAILIDLRYYPIMVLILISLIHRKILNIFSCAHCHLQKLFWLSVSHHFFKYIFSTIPHALFLLGLQWVKVKPSLIFHVFPRPVLFPLNSFLLFRLHNCYWSVFASIGSSSIISILLLSP